MNLINKKGIVGLFLLVPVLAVVFVSYRSDCFMREEEALEFVTPVIEAVCAYQRLHRSYPQDLTQIEEFPYPIKRYPNKSTYYFTDQPGLHMQSMRQNQSKLFIKIDFLQCSAPESVHSVDLYFKPDCSYRFNYYKLPSAWRQ